MYVRCGYNVYPIEVEHVLAEHPDVAEVAVISAPIRYAARSASRSWRLPRPGFPRSVSSAACAGGAFLVSDLAGVTMIELAGMGPVARCARALGDLGARWVRVVAPPTAGRWQVPWHSYGADPGEPST